MAKNRKNMHQGLLVDVKRAVYSASTIRNGLARLKNSLPVRLLPVVIEELLRDRFVAPKLAINAFPSNFASFSKNRRLEGGDLDRDYLWAASIMKKFSVEITEFISLKEKFEVNFLHGHLDLADKWLELIRERFGVSIWYLGNRLQLTHLRHGLSVQKDLLEEVVSIENIEVFVGLFAYYFSMRSEDNYSYNSIAAELSELLGEVELGDYVRFHVLPYDLTEINNPVTVVAWEESHPVIDRYLALVSMMQLQIAKLGVDGEYGLIRLAVEQLDAIDDRNLTGLRIIFGNSSGGIDSGFENDIRCFDAYTEGRYEECLDSIRPSIELTARALVMANKSLRLHCTDNSIVSGMLKAMTEVLLCAPTYQAARGKLKKLCMTCPRHDISAEIVFFLERSHNCLTLVDLSEINILSAVCSRFINPWHDEIFGLIKGGSENYFKLINIAPNSSAIRLREILKLASIDAANSIDKLNIPSYRSDIYKGNIALNNGDCKGAANYYKNWLQCDNAFVANRVSSYLYMALLADGDIEGAVEVVVDHCIKNTSAYILYPLDNLIVGVLSDKQVSGSIDAAILLRVASRNISTKWEGDISDVYEKIMTRFNETRPSFLISKIGEIGVERLVYFLRYICVPRVLDDTIDFASVSEIDEERISICQILIDIDPEFKDIYEVEIKSITREKNIFQALRKLESSKIFVDEAGIRLTVEGQLRDGFERFKRLAQSPKLIYQAERLAKLLEDLIGESSAVDLKNLQLPTSEVESLFGNILAEFATEFAINPAFGLDTHLSTTIRHGAFEGHIRSPLAANDLLCHKNVGTDYWNLPKRWELAFNDASHAQQEELRRALGKFTGRVEDQINLYLKELLHVRGVDLHLNGLFNFLTTRDERLEIMRTLGDNIKYEEFIDRLFSWCWAITEKSLLIIRAELQTNLLATLNTAIGSLLSSTASLNSLQQYSRFSDAIINSRTNLHVAMDNVVSWFRRSVETNRDPFDFEMALDVALKQIQNCYVKSPMKLEKNISVKNKVAGQYLDGVVEILFILLQNIIKHSGYVADLPKVTVCVVENCNELSIEISNRVSSGVDIENLRNLADQAAQEYRGEAAMQMARQEGGSGLSKVWRIVEHDLSVRHRLALMVENCPPKFIAKLELFDLVN